MKTLPGFRTLLALVLLGAFACVSYGQPVLLINYTNQIWRYNDTSTTAANPEGLFQATLFDDSVAGWKTGHGLFGNDGAGVYDAAGSPFSGPNNGFSFPLDRSGGRVTFYFRTHFTYSGATAGVTLYSTNYLDDGALYFINGVEAGRLRVPAAPTALTWDTLGENPPTEGIPYFLQLNPAGLVVGDNVLAVEVHQSSTGSSDVAFAMKLVAIQPYAPVILDTTQPSNRVVLAHRVTTLSVRADASPPISYEWYHDNVLIADATNANYTIPDMGPSDAGAYFARVSNPVGSVDSRVATVTYTEDSTAPQVLRAVGGANFDKIFVYFDEVVEENSSQDGFAYQVSDEVGTPYAILSAVRNPDGASVTVTLDPSAGVIPENTLVTVNISAVMDLANNTMVETNVTFRSNVRGCGGLVFEAFRPLSTTDNNLNTTLLANPDYPNFAQERLTMSAFDTRTVYPDDSHEGYGGRVRGIFIPRASGNWVFYLGSDDSSRLWLNPSGPGSEGKVLLTQETGCCTDWTAHQSAPVPLIAGNPYYIEGIYKEGTGGDYLKVSARLESEGRPPDNPNGQ